MSVKITREWLKEHRTSKGGWNNSQLASIGVEWPPTKGWPERIIGKEISDEQARLFVEYGKSQPTSKKRKAIKKQLKKQAKISNWMRSKSGPVTILTAPEVDFLQTYEWRRLRMQVLRRYGARCQCCGATPADGVRMHVDHIKPRKIYPELALDPSNLQVLCEVCNHGKENWDMTDWRKAKA